MKKSIKRRLAELKLGARKRGRKKLHKQALKVNKEKRAAGEAEKRARLAEERRDAEARKLRAKNRTQIARGKKPRHALTASEKAARRKRTMENIKKGARVARDIGKKIDKWAKS